MTTAKRPAPKPGDLKHVGVPCVACGTHGYVHYRDHEDRREQLGLREGQK